MFAFHSVGFSHIIAEREPVAVFSDLSFALEKGERTVLLGINGSGKSTLLRLLDGLYFPQTGEVRFEGEPLTEKALRRGAFARAFRKKVALLFQNPASMFFHATVRDEIAFGPMQLGLDADAAVTRWSGHFGIEGLLERFPFSLSPGQQQKVALAALLAVEPEVLLLDEPTASLDPKSTGWLVDTLDSLGLTTVVTTHDLSLAPELGEKGLLLGPGGKLLSHGPIREITGDLALLDKAGMTHTHRHRHGETVHTHSHIHNWR